MLTFFIRIVLSDILTGNTGISDNHGIHSYFVTGIGGKGVGKVGKHRRKSGQVK